MITAALPDVSRDLQGFLGKAADEDVLIVKDGRPVAVLHAFADDEDYQDYLLLTNPTFHSLIAESRREYAEGKHTPLEDIDNI